MEDNGKETQSKHPQEEDDEEDEESDSGVCGMMNESILSVDFLKDDDEKSINGNPVSMQAPVISDIDLLSVEQTENLYKQPSLKITETKEEGEHQTIVLRRRPKKMNSNAMNSSSNNNNNNNGSAKQQQKKRVSFHEDILKNTRTDNIHIEHGFITYNNSGYFPGVAKNRLRRLHYSWCSERDQVITTNGSGAKTSCGRNACSDVLDYYFHHPDQEAADDNISKALEFDRSGVFEYVSENHNNPPERHHNKIINIMNAGRDSNNSNEEIDDSDEEDSEDFSNCSSSSFLSLNNTNNYVQSKSNSCDCIQQQQSLRKNIASIKDNNHNKGASCYYYYSEPNIMGSADERSIWRSDKQPKSSCLKKSTVPTTAKAEQLSAVKDIFSNQIAAAKKYNRHQMLFGSLKSIFGIMALPERGVPEGCEDLQTVDECMPGAILMNHTHQNNQQLHRRHFLSKSLDQFKNGHLLDEEKNDCSDNQKNHNFIHNVDAQLRRRCDDDLYAPTPRKNSREHETPLSSAISEFGTSNTSSTESSTVFRNKFIVNCESTVFEHTGVSYCYDNTEVSSDNKYQKELGERVRADGENTNYKESQADENIKTLIDKESLKEKLANIFFFRGFKDGSRFSSESNDSNVTETVKTPAENVSCETKFRKESPENLKAPELIPEPFITPDFVVSNGQRGTTTQSCSNSDVVITELKLNDDIISPNIDEFDTQKRYSRFKTPTVQFNFHPCVDESDISFVFKRNRHLSSPVRTRRLSPDLFSSNECRILAISRHSTSTFPVVDDFNDILKAQEEQDDNIISETYDSKDPDLVIVQTKSSPTLPTQNVPYSSQRPSLINRLLRSVTQKKKRVINLKPALEKSNVDDKRLFTGDLYYTTPPLSSHSRYNNKLTEELNAEIATEIENAMKCTEAFESEKGGVGEVTMIPLALNVPFLRDPTEKLLKVYKLYTGYNYNGQMTPVLVFLTDRTLYVTDLTRNKLCNKFVLPYVDLDVILIGPFGNTVLLSNGTRDMQQVLLAGGTYPAEGLVASLELCARRGGCPLPAAVGQLTLDHLAPLQAFVRQNLSVIDENDRWLYYAVINVPAVNVHFEGYSTNTDEWQEPLGPQLNGPLMHRTLHPKKDQIESWQAGYFLLKAGVLYMFVEAGQRVPIWTMIVNECRGARRTPHINTTRPHCFEISQKSGAVLQLAAPDEYCASEWLQGLVQTASGLLQMQKIHKTLGCTLAMTPRHLITLRENFSAPLRRSNRDEINTANNISEITSVGSMSSLYGRNGGIDVLTCEAIEEITSIRIPAEENRHIECDPNWWCQLEFSCQEVHQDSSSSDFILFFATKSERNRFLNMLEGLWHSVNRNCSQFPMHRISKEADAVARNCTRLFSELNQAWQPLLAAALSHPKEFRL